MLGWVSVCVRGGGGRGGEAEAEVIVNDWRAKALLCCALDGSVGMIWGINLPFKKNKQTLRWKMCSLCVCVCVCVCVCGRGRGDHHIKQALEYGLQSWPR